jgi:exopolyphosphatase / guanosine-5'-triphosphate,3'-diphosphate pyrophosphatase
MTARGVKDGDVLAAVDLGSNSFHMVVARYAHGQLVVIDRLREAVRLGGGLNARGQLSEVSQRRALSALRRFGQRLQDMQAGTVRVVGTNTLRQARSVATFLQRAGRALGHPVEIIAGIEEARLIYLGASHHLPGAEGQRLVVDIGGGSTEIIRGRGLEPLAMESLTMGCVSLSSGAFPRGKLSPRNFRAARLTARLELEPVKAAFRKVELAQVVGTSGTIRAAQSVLGALEPAAGAGITVAGLELLIRRMQAAGHVDNLQLPELSRDRAEVFPGGVAILVEVMAALNLERVQVSDGALREGILYDLLGRLTDEDARVRTVRAMAARYHVDTSQAERVEATAQVLLAQAAAQWDLGTEADGNVLAWAARLHELGLDIAHSNYHRHGAYVLENADLPGFPREEQQVIACLVRGHRRALERSEFLQLSKDWQRRALRLTVLLRLAVLFQRSRTASGAPALRLRVQGRSLRLQLPRAWLAARPLTGADLEREQDLLARAGFQLVIQRRAGKGRA